MKKFLKYLSIFLVFGIGSLFVIPQARANFIGSVGEIIFSLRGVEEEAVNVFVPSPPEPEISLGNSESEALTAEQVLYEESITSLSAVGSCDDSVGEENRSFAQSIANGDFNFGTSGLENFNTDLNSIANQIDVDFTMTNDGLKVEIDRPEKDFVYKLLVNNVDVTINQYTNTSQVFFDKEIDSFDLKLRLYDNIGRSQDTKSFRYTKEAAEEQNREYKLALKETGISVNATEASEGYEKLTLPSGFNSRSSGDAETLIVEFSEIPGASYYKIQFGSQIIYTQSPTYTFIDANQSFNATVKITPIDSNLVLGNSFEQISGREVTFSQPNSQPGSRLSFSNRNGVLLTYNDGNDYGDRVWNGDVSNIIVTQQGAIGFDISAPPSGEGYIVLENNDGIFAVTGWRGEWNEDDPYKTNILFYPPENFDGSFTFRSGRGSGRLSNKISVTLPDDIYQLQKSRKVDISNPNFIPRFNKDIENLEAVLAEKGTVLLYDLLGPTQVEFNWRPMMGADAWKTRAFNIYVNGDCVATQRAWNIKEGDGKSLMSQIDLITYAVIGRLPSMADVEIEVKAVGFNGVESEGEKGIIRTYLEPQVSLIDLGVIDTNWIVYGEFAYIYYHLSTTKQEYESYKANGNDFYLQARMCCDENDLVYYPTIQFVPVPEYATCSDLTIVGKTSRDNPAFLGIRTNPDLTITELIKDDDGEELGFEASGGEVGDIIYAINGVAIYSEVQLADEINKYTGGESIEISIVRSGEGLILETNLSTYPERFNIDEINKATGCFNANGQVIGVFKIKMKDGFKKNQYMSSFYFYQRDSTATERLGEEAMITVGNKTFSRNGNIYSGIGPDDALVSYGTHSVDFSKASFSISSNNKRASARRDVTEYVPLKNQVEESDGPVSQLELFVPSESRGEPYSKYANDYQDYEDLVKKNILPIINQNSIGDCCYRDEIRGDNGRVFEKGSYVFYFKTNNPKILGGWDIYSESCSLDVFDLSYDYAIENKNFLRNTYYPEEERYPVVASLTVSKDRECLFDLGEYRDYPYVAISANTCYVKEDDENNFFCISLPYLILPINSWG